MESLDVQGYSHSRCIRFVVMAQLGLMLKSSSPCWYFIFEFEYILDYIYNMMCILYMIYFYKYIMDDSGSANVCLICMISIALW